MIARMILVAISGAVLGTGDVLLNLNGRDIVTVQDFHAIADARPEAWQIVLQRDGRMFRSYVSG